MDRRREVSALVYIGISAKRPGGEERPDQRSHSLLRRFDMVVFPLEVGVGARSQPVVNEAGENVGHEKTYGSPKRRGGRFSEEARQLLGGHQRARVLPVPLTDLEGGKGEESNECPTNDIKAAPR